MNATKAAGAGSAGYGGVSPAAAWWSVFVFTIALMLNFLDRQVMTLLVTPIKKDLGISDTEISLLIGFMFVLFYLGVGIPISRLVDRGPRKWIIGVGIAFWSLMTAACGLAANYPQLAAARTFMRSSAHERSTLLVRSAAAVRRKPARFSFPRVLCAAYARHAIDRCRRQRA